MESKGGRNSSIVFCTNGILLRVLISSGGGRSKREAGMKTGKQDFPDITHIIVVGVLVYLVDSLNFFPYTRVRSLFAM